MKGMKMIAVNTSLGTNFLLSAHRHVSFAELRDLIREEHLSCFPDRGDIEIGSLTVEYDGKQYHITDSLFVGQVVKKGWSKIHAEVSSGFPRNNSENTKGKKISGNLDISSAEVSKAKTADIKLQGLSSREQDKEECGSASDTQKIGFLASKSFGCPLLFMDDPYTQPLPGTNLSALVTLDSSMIEKELHCQKAKTNNQKGSTCSVKSLYDGFQECNQNLDCREQVVNTKCLQATDNRKKEHVLESSPKTLHNVAILGCPPSPDGAMLGQKKGILVTEAEASSPKAHGFKSVSIELNGTIHRDETLPNGLCSTEIAHKCNSRNADNWELNERALDYSSSERETACPLNSNEVQKEDEQREAACPLNERALDYSSSERETACPLNSNEVQKEDEQPETACPLNEKALDYSSSERETACPVNSNEVQKEDEQLNSQNCCKELSLESSGLPVNTGHSHVIECLPSGKKCSSPTKSSSACRNEIDTVHDKMSLLNGNCGPGCMIVVRDSLQDDSTEESGLGNSCGYYENDNGCSTAVPARASADEVPETQESQMGTQISVSAVKEVSEHEKRELPKKLNGASGKIMKETDSKPSGHASFILQNASEHHGNENMKVPAMIDHITSDGLNTWDKDKNSRLILPKNNEKHKLGVGSQRKALSVQEDIFMVLRQNLTADVPEQQINVGVDSGRTQPCNNSTDFQENHVRATHDHCVLTFERCTEKTSCVQREILKGNTEDSEYLENRSENRPLPTGQLQKRNLKKEDGCDSRVQSLGEDNDILEVQMNRSGSTGHCGDKPVREEQDEYSETACKTPGKALQKRKDSTGLPKSPRQISSQKNCIVGKEIMNMALGKLHKKKKRRKRERDDIEICHNITADIDGAASQYDIAQVGKCTRNCSHRQCMESLAEEGNWKGVTMGTNAENADHNASFGNRCQDNANARNMENTSFIGNQNHNTIDTLCAAAEKDVTDMDVDLITRKISLDVFEFTSHETGNRKLKSRFLAGRNLGKRAEQLDRIRSKGVETDLVDDFTSRERTRKIATRSSSPKVSITESTDRFIQNKNPVKGFSKEIFTLLVARRATTEGGCLKESVRDRGLSQHNANVAEATLKESSQTTVDGKIPCPAGCGRLYAGKTSAWYRHRRKCSGNCI